MESINDIQEEIIDEFSGFDDWMDRYSYIIELGNAVEPLDAKYKVPDRNNPVVLHGDGHLHVHARTAIRLSASSCRHATRRSNQDPSPLHCRIDF